MTIPRFFFLTCTHLYLFSHAQKIESDPCASYVSAGDHNAGISAYYDQLCVENSGGLGCFASFCRLCQSSRTQQSSHLLSCPVSGSLSQEPEATSSECASYVAIGDQNVGISAYFEAQCTQISLTGCFPNSSSCRFCKRTSTPQSSSFVACPTIQANSCATAVFSSKLKSISYTTNTNCFNQNSLDTGCVKETNCQLCRQTNNEENQFLMSCKVLGAKL